MRRLKKLFSIPLVTVALGAMSPTTGVAAVWQLDSVLGSSGNFGASLFHTASGSNPMSGSTILNFTGWNIAGSFNDATGVLSATITDDTDNLRSFTLSNSASVGSALDFSGPGSSLAAVGTLDVDFSAALEAAYSSLSDGTFTFTPGFVCCGNVAGDDPNSFSGSVMALWGATNYPWTVSDPNRFGMDLRLGATPVPIPAALPLLVGGLGILGFMGWRRKRSAL